MANQLRAEKMDFWIEKGQNVLFTGRHGVGKTAMVIEAFKRNNLNYRYFSASTMDPWVDFVGVPKEQKPKMNDSFELIRDLAHVDESLAVEWMEQHLKLQKEACQKILLHIQEQEQHESYLKLVRPAGFHDGAVEAIFFDEFNRSPKKVRNAVMELLQFKAINGHAFPNLKVIWAAVNPVEDEEFGGEYQVEEIDPAQLDRFQIQVNIPYRPSGEYFKDRYGERWAKVALDWWDELPDDRKKEVSPRRLDYALNIHEQRGEMRDVLPYQSNVSKLSSALNTGPITEKLESFMQHKDVSRARQFLSNENNLTAALKYIPQSETMMEFFLPLLSRERISSTVSENDKICKYVMGHIAQVPIFADVCRNIINAGTNQKLVRKIRRLCTDNPNIGVHMNRSADDVAPPLFNGSAAGGTEYTKYLEKAKQANLGNTEDRLNLLADISRNIPEKLSADQAVDTLSLLNKLSEKFSPTVINSDAAQSLVPVVNHCVGELNRNTGYSWDDIVKRYSNKFKDLVQQIQKAGAEKKLYTPKAVVAA